MDIAPLFVSIVFILTIGLTFYLFYRVLNLSNLTLKQRNKWVMILCIWIIVQVILSLINFYSEKPQINPPKLPMLVGPPLLFIIYLFNSSRGKSFIDSLSLEDLTIISVVRIPVELVLYWLAISKAVPTIMTFDGANFDILAGISAPLIYYFGFRRQRINKYVYLIWNCVSLGLLLNIIIIAILSVPFSFQQISFEQPNIALLHFPYSLLPGFIVPVVLFSHFVALRRILQGQSIRLS